MAEPGSEPGSSDSTAYGISPFAAVLHIEIHVLISIFCCQSVNLGLNICLTFFTPQKYNACKEVPQGKSVHFSEPVYTFVAFLAALTSWLAPLE